LAAGYSQSTAETRAYGWVSNSQEVLYHKLHITAAIKAAPEQRSKRTEVAADRVLTEYAKLGFADIRKAVSWGSTPVIVPRVEGDGRPPERIYPVELVASEDMDDATAAAVCEVSLTPQGVKIKMYDKKAALDSMAKHLGMFNDGASVAINPTLKVEVNAREEFINRILGIAARTRTSQGGCLVY
ncbi:MAG: terminase small subunit, partial [Rhodobacteraceae bacterium]|nr:terminase small subunit [Paracoccaceae bacterium]